MKKSSRLFRYCLVSSLGAWLGMAAASAADVSSILLAKGQLFQQNNSNAPVARLPRPFQALGNVELNPAGAGSTAVVQTPPGSYYPSITFTNNPESLNITVDLTNKLALDNVAKPGVYHFTITTIHDGVQTPAVTVGPDNYPAVTPRVQNWTEAQAWDADGAFTVRWAALPAADTNDFVQFVIRDGSSNEVFQSVEFGEPGALNGLATSVEIPAGTLAADQLYVGRLLFARAKTTNTTYVGVSATTAFFKETQFPITTLPAPPPQGRLQFSAATWSVGEAGVVVNLTVTRTGGSADVVSVNYATANGTATAGADYTGVASALSFNPGQTSKDFQVTILDDLALEGNETFLVNLSSPQGGAILGNRTNAVVTILDNELATAGTLQFSLGAYSVSEAGPSAPVTITRTGGLTSNVTVNFATSDGSATAGVHYTAVNSNLVFTPGLASKIVNVPVANNSTVDGSKTVNLTLSNPNLGTSLGLHDTAVLTITDNDVAGTMQFSLAAYSLSETGGLATITVTRTGGSASAVTVNFATSNLTASAGSDYSATNATLTFGSNQTSATFQIPITDDLLPEGNETIQLRLRSPGGGGKLGTISNAVFTIIDNEITLQFSRTMFTNTEAGPTALLTVARTGPVAGTVTVSYATQNGTAFAGTDYRGTNGTLTFAPNVVSQNISIPILNDTAVEGGEIFFVNLGNPVGALLGTRSNATVNLLDNDLGGILQFSLTNYTVVETGPAAIITVTRTGGAASGVTVTFTTSNGTATAASDYTAVSSNLVFAANEVSKTIQIPVWNDSLDETNETVNLFLSNPTGGASLGTRSNAVLVITDNDAGGLLQFSLAAYSISETGGLATITVNRTGGTASEVTVDFATSNLTATAGADYSATNGTLTFGSNQLTATFQIRISDDATPEGNETVALRLGNVTGGAKLGVISNSVLTILDNEITIQFARSTYTNSEAGPSVVLTVERTGPAAASGSVQYATANGSAISPGDYKGTNGTLNFGPNVVSQTITIPIVNDTIHEGDENFTVTLSNPSVGVLLGARTQATVTIVDNDAAGVLQFSAALYAVTEGTANATITVTRSNGLASGVTVQFATTTGTATPGSDYTAVSSNLTFAANEISKTILIPIATDVTSEPTETVNLVLSNVTGGATLGTRSNATLNIANAPDPNAIPAAGPEFLTAAVPGGQFIALPASVTATYIDTGFSQTLTIEGTVVNASSQKTLKFQSLHASGPGVVQLLPDGSTGTAAYTQLNFNPPSLVSYASNRTGGGGTVTIDVLDVANKICTGRFTVTAISGTGAPVIITGSFRAIFP